MQNWCWGLQNNKDKKGTAMAIDTEKFEKYKESEHFIVYLEKKPVIKGQIEMIVQYKKYNLSMRCLLTDDVFKLFFEPEEYKKIYISRQR